MNTSLSNNRRGGGGGNQFLRCFKGKLEAFVTVKVKWLVEEIMLKSEEDNQSAEDSCKNTQKKESLTSFSLGIPGHIYLRDCCFIPSSLPQLFILHVVFNEERNKGMIRINSG